MTATITLTADELRIIGHSINWELNVSYERTPPPELSQENRQVLRILFNELCSQQRACQYGAKTVLVQVGGSYVCEDGQMLLPQLYYRLMTDAVASFLGELRHSPTELEVVTGLPGSIITGLLARMQAMTPAT